MIRLLIGILTAMWMCSGCEKVDTMEREDANNESEGVKEIVMHVGGSAWSNEDWVICDDPSNGSRREASGSYAATRAL